MNNKNPLNKSLEGISIAFALTGSFCTFSEALTQMETLTKMGADIIPIMSDNAYKTDTRFGSASDFKEKIKSITKKEIIHTITGAEPIGPKKMADIMLVAPCTGNTLSKLASGITDTPVTMAVKSHVRNARPVVLCIATNDALAGSAKNIGILMNTRNYYFTPLRQDDFKAKPTSLVADFGLIGDSIINALKGIQLEPIVFS